MAPPLDQRLPSPALTVDAVVFGVDDGELKILLIQRGMVPFAGSWALPGGFVKLGEDLEKAVRRELESEAGVRPSRLEQVAAYGRPDRDPRQHVVSIAFAALVRLDQHSPHAGTNTRLAAWFAVDRLPELAFDHALIVRDALVRLRSELSHTPVGIDLLPPKFPLRDLQHLHEQISGRSLDKRNFRRSVLDSGLLQELDEREPAARHRSARLYSFNQDACSALET